MKREKKYQGWEPLSFKAGQLTPFLQLFNCKAAVRAVSGKAKPQKLQKIGD